MDYLRLSSAEYVTFFYLCISLVVAVFYYTYQSRRKVHCVTSHVPTAYGLPLIGICHQLMPVKKLLPKLESYFNEFKTMTYCIWIGTEPFLVTIDPDTVQAILSSEVFLNKSSSLYGPINNAISNGIITSQVFKWKHNRRLMATSFSQKILTGFIPIFRQGTQEAIQKLDALVGKGEQEVFEIIKRCFFRMALETTMGVVLRDGNEYDEKLVQGFNFMIEKIANESILSTIKLGFLAHTPTYYTTLRFIRDYVEKLITSKYNANGLPDNNNNARDLKPEQCSTKKKPSTNIFIRQAQSFYENGLFQRDDVINETKTVIAGSFETVSTTIYSVLVMLAMHPEVQEKLYQEVLTVSPTKDFQFESFHLKQVPYMDMVIDETLRLVQSIPIIGRQAITDTYISTEQLEIPKDMQVIIPIFLIHRNTQIWGSDAKLFNPDRFLPENMEKRHPYAFLPFSKGPRNCIGSRYAQIALRVSLLGILRHFKFSTSFKYEDLVFLEHVSLRYEKEPHLQVERRPE